MAPCLADDERNERHRDTDCAEDVEMGANTVAGVRAPDLPGAKPEEAQPHGDLGRGREHFQTESAEDERKFGGPLHSSNVRVRGWRHYAIGPLEPPRSQ